MSEFYSTILYLALRKRYVILALAQEEKLRNGLYTA